MNAIQFESAIRDLEALPSDLVRERVYGEVRVTADWRGERVMLEVGGEVGRLDAPAFVELFFHDAFLLLNLAAPALFGGTIATRR